MTFCKYTIVIIVLSIPFFHSQDQFIYSLKNEETSKRHLNVEGGESQSSSASNSKLTNSYCEQKFGKRQFLNSKQIMKYPPTMLYTLPGVGNHWIQLLSEYATGIYTGSGYREQLNSLLPGLSHCDRSVSMVKLHTNHWTIQDLKEKGSNFSDKCKESSRIIGFFKFQRAVILIRNPFDSMWSEYLRRHTPGHTGLMMKRDYREDIFIEDITDLTSRYLDAHTILYKNELQKQFSKDNILFIRYENFNNRQQNKHLIELKKLVLFLNITNNNKKIMKERLKCAFVLADTPKAHRKSPTEHDDSIYISKSFAYTKSIVCKIWNQIGSIAVSDGYSIFNNYDCSTT